MRAKNSFLFLFLFILSIFFVGGRLPEKIMVIKDGFVESVDYFGINPTVLKDDNGCVQFNLLIIPVEKITDYLSYKEKYIKKYNPFLVGASESVASEKIYNIKLCYSDKPNTKIDRYLRFVRITGKEIFPVKYYYPYTFSEDSYLQNLIDNNEQIDDEFKEEFIKNIDSYKNAKTIIFVPVRVCEENNEEVCGKINRFDNFLFAIFYCDGLNGIDVSSLNKKSNFEEALYRELTTSSDCEQIRPIPLSKKAQSYKNLKFIVEESFFVSSPFSYYVLESEGKFVPKCIGCKTSKYNYLISKTPLPRGSIYEFNKLGNLKYEQKDGVYFPGKDKKTSYFSDGAIYYLFLENAYASIPVLSKLKLTKFKFYNPNSYPKRLITSYFTCVGSDGVFKLGTENVDGIKIITKSYFLTRENKCTNVIEGLEIKNTNSFIEFLRYRFTDYYIESCLSNVLEDGYKTYKITIKNKDLFLEQFNKVGGDELSNFNCIKVVEKEVYDEYLRKRGIDINSFLERLTSIEIPSMIDYRDRERRRATQVRNNVNKNRCIETQPKIKNLVYLYYHVKKGDTLIKIAKKLTLQHSNILNKPINWKDFELCVKGNWTKVSDLKNYTIYPNQQVRVRIQRIINSENAIQPSFEETIPSTTNESSGRKTNQNKRRKTDISIPTLYWEDASKAREDTFFIYSCPVIIKGNTIFYPGLGATSEPLYFEKDKPITLKIMGYTRPINLNKEYDSCIYIKDYTGAGIKIDLQTNTISGFKRVKYVVHIENSKNITIENGKISSSNYDKKLKIGGVGIYINKGYNISLYNLKFKNNDLYSLVVLSSKHIYGNQLNFDNEVLVTNSNTDVKITNCAGKHNVIIPTKKISVVCSIPKPKERFKIRLFRRSDSRNKDNLQIKNKFEVNTCGVSINKDIVYVNGKKYRLDLFKPTTIIFITPASLSCDKIIMINNYNGKKLYITTNITNPRNVFGGKIEIENSKRIYFKNFSNLRRLQIIIDKKSDTIFFEKIHLANPRLFSIIVNNSKNIKFSHLDVENVGLYNLYEPYILIKRSQTVSFKNIKITGKTSKDLIDVIVSKEVLFDDALFKLTQTSKLTSVIKLEVASRNISLSKVGFDIKGGLALKILSTISAKTLMYEPKVCMPGKSITIPIYYTGSKEDFKYFTTCGYVKINVVK